MSDEELEANQLQVDAILNTVNRLSGSVNFQGQKLLDGSYSYQTSGANLSAVSNLSVNSARLADGASQAVTVAVTASAATGAVTYTSAGHTDNFTIEIGGSKGTEQLSFLSSVTNAGMASAINALTNVTGVSAATSGSVLLVNSTEFGSDEFASIKTISGTSGITDAKDFGTDASITVNGAAANVDGLNVSFRSANLDVEFDLSDNAAVNVAGASKTFNVIGGGATFALGSKVTEGDKASIGITSVSTGSLGLDGQFLSSLASGGANSLTSGNFVSAQESLDAAVKQVSQARGRLGSFQKFVIGSTVNQLGVAFENAAAAESAIRDADFAEETAALTRSQILAQASTTVLSQANQQPQRVLSLLG